jgi:hypothetical protein
MSGRNKARRSAIAELRHIYCRVFGLVDHPLSTCVHGCRPTRRLADRQSKRLFRRLEALRARVELEEQC